jgi:hypothetical protein
VHSFGPINPHKSKRSYNICVIASSVKVAE